MEPQQWISAKNAGGGLMHLFLVLRENYAQQVYSIKCSHRILCAITTSKLDANCTTVKSFRLGTGGVGLLDCKVASIGFHRFKCGVGILN